MDTRSVELSASLRFTENKCAVSSLELDQLKADLERAQLSVTSLETSLEANKSELGRLYLAWRENVWQETELQKGIDTSKSRNVTLEASRTGARRVAKMSDDKAKQKELQLSVIRDCRGETQSALDSLRVAHGDFIGKDEKITQLPEELDSSEHREVQTLNALSEAHQLVIKEQGKVA